MKVWICILVLSVLMISTHAWAGCEKGIKAVKAGDLTTALQELLPCANAGDREAQLLVGKMLLEGQGIAENKAEGVRWIRKAAEQGLPEAQFAMGEQYYLGDHYDSTKDAGKDNSIAMEWFRKAADQDHTGAQYILGTMYCNGYGKKDTAEGVKWIRKAAELGLADAQYALGRLYAGAGNDSEAVKWCRKAADQGMPDAQSQMGLAYYHGHGIPVDYPQAIAWFQKAAENNDTRAFANLSRMYSEGTGVTADDDILSIGFEN